MDISVIIPTFQRRALVVSAVVALRRQTFRGDFEVVVVVDGSTDGTSEALRALSTPFPLTVLEQPNQGPAAARSAGGAAARGAILLFIDDDMEADPDLLTEHARSHQSGAEIVIGHMPLHPQSPRGILSAGVKEWVDRRAARLSVAGASVRVSDLVGGQISVAREAFHAVGGFDARLRCGEDAEFGYRLLRNGARAVFNQHAITHQWYVVTPRQFLRRWRQSGRSAVEFARKHPPMAKQVLAVAVNRRRFRVLARIVPVRASLEWLAVSLVERGFEGSLVKRLFFLAQAIAYCRGMQDAGGMPGDHPLRVLAYHAITDTKAAGRFQPYGVSPTDFHRQIAALQRFGYRFVSAEEVLHFLRGTGGLPRRPVLLTFDDCYVSVAEHALPILKERAIPAVAFAVSGRLGETNDWTQGPGASPLPLLDADGLRQLAIAGVEIGGHSQTHPRLPRLSATELFREIDDSCEELRALDVGDVRLFAYPYGEYDPAAQASVQRAGCQAAFTVEPGLVRRGVGAYDIPRIEILRTDVGWRFHWKVAFPSARWGGLPKRAHELRKVWRQRGAPLVLGAVARIARVGHE